MVFGFGEFGYRNSSYEINAYPPYGPGGGRAFLGQISPGRILSTQELAMIYSSGSEAAATMAQKVRRNWLLNGEVYYQDWLL